MEQTLVWRFSLELHQLYDAWMTARNYFAGALYVSLPRRWVCHRKKVQPNDSVSIFSAA